MHPFVRTTLRGSRHLLLLVLGAGLASCAGTPDSIPVGADSALHGNLTQGGKFGVAVGQSTANLQNALWAQGYGYEGVVACSSETRSLLGCRSDEAYMSFQPVEIGRKGHIYLKAESERVSQIAWDFKFVAYLDN